MVQNREKITNALRRNIKSGSNYGKYIPASDCSSVFLGTGKTDFAVQSMKKWALKYVHHTQNLAPLFKDGNLIDICYKIKNFAYSHFQYKLDGHTQQIKSPACSWATRYDGIDCKNYSIFVSTLLQNLNITHYFRRIKQPNYLPLHFTHVYVVVPVNQKDISDGYYVIDGIIGGFQEVSYIEKDDVLVYLKKQKNAKNAKIVQLGAVANQPNQASYVEQLTLTDINALVDGISKREQALMQTLKQRDIATVTGTIGIVGGVAGVVGLIPVAAPVAKVIELTAFVVGAVSKILMTMFYDPCAGAEYTATGVGERIKAELEPKLDKELKYIHSCVNDGTISGAESFINTILKEIDLGYAHYFHEVSVHRGNPCSVQALKDYRPFIEKIKAAVDLFVDVIKRSYTGIFKIDIETKQASVTDRTWYFIVPSNRSVKTFSYRRMRFSRFNENLKVKYPYGSEVSFATWAENNRKYLNKEYGDFRGDKYIKEVAPFAEKIKEIRDSVLTSYSSSLIRYEREELIRKEMIPIYLRYDTRYAEELEKLKKEKIEKYIADKVNFSKDLKEILTKRHNYDKIHKEFEKLDGSDEIKKKLLLALVSMGLIYTIIN